MGSPVQRHIDVHGASDLAIVELRRLMTDAAKKVAEGGAAIGTEAVIPQARIAAHEGVYPEEVDWRTLVVGTLCEAAE